MDMRPEILSLSLCRLEKSYLKSVRLVSKAFERAAVPFLVDEVYFSTNEVDIELAQLINSRFNAYVKAIIFSSFYWHEMDWREFKRQISYQAKSKFDLKDKLLPKHLTIGWDDYCRLPEEQQEMLESGTCIAHLCFALHTVPNLRRLVVTGFEPADSFANEIKVILPLLKDIELNSLSGGWQFIDERSLPYHMSPADQRYFNFYGHVEKFFFGDGENPFTERAIAAYNHDGHSDRPA
ncbi:hypothetical protein OEA41_009692 [Lepraria neglecta]|uniref:Uncharacterized protein n=1 Tax=Lepraria neglecta TaxID=209136 RepID=A0AAE0DI89_9LECA|nr:hypothetical protein OEA41_009692 [Lepraria neglecta]